MQLFLNNKILTEPCYSCKCCKNSKSDLTIGDAWGASPSSLNKHSGISVIILHSERGESLIKLVNSAIKQVNGDSSFLKTSYGYMHNYTKPNDADRIKRSICSPKIAMVTIPGHKNVGNTLQAYALQQKIKEIVPSADIKLINQYNTAPNSFFEKYVKYEPHGYNSNYDMLVVGSDQIWSDEAYIRKMGVPFNDQWLNRPCSYKLVYGASFGKHELSFTPDQRKDISMSLKQVSYIGVREMSGIFVLDKYFGIHNAVSVIDPTMLHDADFYLNTINESRCLDTDGIFAYILDNNTEWQSSLKKLADTLVTPVLPFDGSCEQFIHNMNVAKYVITDSYHGSVFSLIFNKPFITYRNVARGNDRFDDLCVRFKPIKGNFVTSIENIPNQVNLLEKTPNVQQYIDYFRKGSIDFLQRGLMQL